MCRAHGPTDLSRGLLELEAWLANDLAAVEAELAALPRRGSVANAGAGHQLDLGGKLLRPMCVALAARLGRGFGAEAREMAVAVELMHNATLLHDDVIDQAELRRGAPAARTVYGNAVSVLAGDWLLVEALQRVHRYGDRDLLGLALDTIDKMVAAEALQLENRGRVNLDRADYYRIINGKTAALFRWAMFAGASAGGLASHHRTSLERFGLDLGVAFQLADDLLDVAGDPAVTGKAAFADLREGRINYPVLLALERDRLLRQEVERQLCGQADEPVPGSLCRRLQRRLISTGSIEECRLLAREYADEAVACLCSLPDGPGRSALATLAVVAADRDS
ncbi:MAG: polyprenyl synthetase family protein [Thermoanaerobaculia bacterium]